MERWIFEPGHTAAEFRARHMMVTWVRGSFTDIHGHLEWDPEDLTRGSVEARIDVSTLFTGEEARDAHLLSDDFLDAENHPEITYRGDRVEPLGAGDLRVTGELTIRGVTRETTLDVRYLGSWETPFWEDGENLGPIRRAGFEATTRIDRHDFGVSWNDTLDRGGVVVGDEVRITLDVEALEPGVIEES
jgi:polyisoprenoid-binding protein YceI